MQYHWLQRKGSESLVLFFCGWGSDFRPFESIPSESCDIICFYSYHTGCIPDWDTILAPYNKHHIVAWSMGVLQAEISLADRSRIFATALAVNGTLLPVHDQYGIPCEAYQQTIDAFSEPSLRKFIQRMCKERSVISSYNEQFPKREITEQKDELIYHQQQSLIRGREQTSLFTKALIGTADMIFPPDNMRNFWEGKLTVVESEYQHFPFYRFLSWEALIAL